MGLKQSKTAKRRDTPPVAYQAGMEAVAIFDYTLKEAFSAANDILEIGTIPAGARITGATILGTAALAATNATVGVMDGEPGAKDDTRELTSDLLFDGVAISNAEDSAPTATCLGIAPSDKHRGLGVTLSANQTAGDTKTITVVLRYIY